MITYRLPSGPSVTLSQQRAYGITFIMSLCLNLQSHYLTGDQAQSSNLGKLLNQALQHTLKCDEEMSEVCSGGSRGGSWGAMEPPPFWLANCTLNKNVSK